MLLCCACDGLNRLNYNKIKLSSSTIEIALTTSSWCGFFFFLGRGKGGGGGGGGGLGMRNSLSDGMSMVSGKELPGMVFALSNYFLSDFEWTY